jgi:GDPmannose 4,6-dehydratase
MIATGNLHTVRDFCDNAFTYLGLNYQDYVKVDPKFYRPTEDVPLVGNSSKALQKLNWMPEKSFNSMIEEMVEYDLAEARKLI